MTASTRRFLGVPFTTLRAPDRVVFWWPLAAAVLCLIVGGAAAFENRADVLAAPALAVMTLGLLASLAVERRRTGRWNRGGLRVLAVVAAATVIVLLLPEYLFGLQLNAIIHRSAISAPVLLLTSAATASFALRHLLGNTPRAQDLAIYPLVALPVAIALTAYGLLIWHVIASGAGGLSLDMLTTPWQQVLVDQAGKQSYVYQVGLRNNIIGTVLLVLMTCAVSILPGVGAGVFMSEYPGRVANVIGFCATMLRSISVFVIGIAAFIFVGLTNGMSVTSPLVALIRGTFTLEGGGTLQPGSGSFVTASVFLSMLVIPIIAKLTEQGLRSVPPDIREGSIALGATQGYGLLRILLPWAAPNIVTALLLGAAEAAGSLSVVLFIGGLGQYGVGPTGVVTTLDFALFSGRYGLQTYQNTMGVQAIKIGLVDTEYTAALLLLVITVGLTAAAMLVRRRFIKRFRGSLAGV